MAGWSLSESPRPGVCGRRGGFTFLELIIALAMLGAAFTVLLSAHGAALRTEAQAQRLMKATLLGRQVLTETESQGFPELGGDEGDFGEDFPGYAWERRVETTEFDRVRLIRIVVSWPERGATGSSEFSYYAVSETP